LNPVAAGIAAVPEASAHTSNKQRVEHVKEQGRIEDPNGAETGSVAGSTAAGAWKKGCGSVRSRIGDDWIRPAKE
jgi:hypothetical protein